ncbi:metalloproteinase inhibitor 2-like [Argopecten irradians]|uniref:metalloproteinase inhibitor 2-like n=1 Tax=Argopecten irradians TaxID=31199 RepID=UPI00370FA4C6
MTLFSALLFAGVVVYGVHTVFGCSCFPDSPHPQAQYCESDLVFIGKIKKVIPPPANSFDEDLEYRVMVKRRFKGSAKGIITVRTANSGAMCGITGLTKGQQYLLTADGQSQAGVYRINLCQSLVLPKSSVTKKYKHTYLCKRQNSYPGRNERNCQCKIQYCGMDDQCGSVPPTTCTYSGDLNQIDCYHKLRCIPSRDGRSCKWSSQNCRVTIG